MKTHLHGVLMPAIFCIVVLAAAFSFNNMLLKPAYALTLEKPLADTAQEARAHRLFQNIRCMVCDGQALAGSDAEHAIDMRIFIRQMIENGAEDTAIYDYFSARYGEQALLVPPKQNDTLLLWFAPLLFFSIGMIGWIWARKKSLMEHDKGNADE